MSATMGSGKGVSFPGILRIFVSGRTHRKVGQGGAVLRQSLWNDAFSRRKEGTEALSELKAAVPF